MALKDKNKAANGIEIKMKSNEKINDHHTISRRQSLSTHPYWPLPKIPLPELPFDSKNAKLNNFFF
jgi:hypothetical protein